MAAPLQIGHLRIGQKMPWPRHALPYLVTGDRPGGVGKSQIDHIKTEQQGRLHRGETSNEMTLPLSNRICCASAAQNAIGIGVMGGMICATAFGIFLVPFLFVLVARLSSRAKSAAPTQIGATS